MAAINPAVLATPAAGVPLTPGPAVDAWFSAALDLASTLDANEIEPKLLRDCEIAGQRCGSDEFQSTSRCRQLFKKCRDT